MKLDGRFEALRHAIVTDTISQPNKLHIIAGLRERGYYVEYRFAGEFLRSRMSVQFEPDGEWQQVASFEFDVRPKLQWSGRPKP